MTTTLLILNDPPYGSERPYNALRLALALLKRGGGVTAFLLADAVACARKGQKTPDGYYNIERMVKRIAAGPGRVLLCGTCMDARGFAPADMIDKAQRSTMDELAAATEEADRVLVF